VKRRWTTSRFDETPEDPQSSLVNLVDIMLVFICGLIVALVSAEPKLARQPTKSGVPDASTHEASAHEQQIVEQGRELAELPEGLRGKSAGAGMTPIGQVYRDPKTGKLILVGE
jgi:hypothetical protein